MKAIVLAGPTASGKTKIAEALLDRYPNLFRIISVDSVMVYRECNIGSGKPTQKELLQYPHELIDHLSLPDIFTAFDFLKTSNALIQQIKSQNQVPLFVGGSMMYINALKNGLSNDTQASQVLRNALRAKEESNPGILHKDLLALNPLEAEKIAENDLVRLIRAIERATMPSTGEKIKGLASSKLLEIGLVPHDRSVLHKNIEQRQQEIISAGLLQECKNILTKHVLPAFHPIQKAVNYKQGFQVIRNQIPEEELFQQSLIATRQLAKKQLTWMRSWGKMKFFDLMDERKLFQYIEKSLEI
ncbi:MAG: tRNA (adenosine(37)-N6)-dimethylallyltransferase MiaA [Gammaproteobacteria bacterium]